MCAEWGHRGALTGTVADKGLNLFNKTISAIVYKMSCTSFLKQLACIHTETAEFDGAVNKQLNAAQQIAAGLTPAHKVLIRKQVKKELAKAKPSPPVPANELHEHLEVLHKAITAGHNEVVRALHEIGQAAVRPVVIKHVFKPPEAPGSLSLDRGDSPAQASDPPALPAKP